MENYEKLTNAIIIQAVKDYRMAYRHLLRDPHSRVARAEVTRQEKFFHTEWYKLLTNVDGTFLLNKIKEDEQQKFRRKEGGKNGAAHRGIS